MVLTQFPIIKEFLDNIPYSAKFLRVFNFANFQLFAKIFKQKFLTCGVQCARAASS